MTTLLILLAATIAAFVLQALFQQLGAWWVGSKQATLGLAALVVVLTTLVSLLAQIALIPLATVGGVTVVVGSLLLMIGTLAATWAIIQRFFAISYGRAALAWLASQIGTVITVLLAVLVVRPWLFEAFKVPTNAMAPTIVGEHYRGVCPHCGGPSIVAASSIHQEEADEDGQYVGICTQCLQTGWTETADLQHAGDRILANKLLVIERWDLIVFRSPQDPSVVFVKRLVGLPGETVFMRDGKVWVNGQSVTPPGELAQLRYRSEIDGEKLFHARDDKPLKLGEDEYFVLGDYSERSADSRYWVRPAR